MVDIAEGERLKKVFRMLLKLGYKYLRKDMRKVGDDLNHSQNPVIKNLNALIVIAANNLHTRDNYQKNMTLGYGQAGLWLITKDTAYRDIFFWTLDKMLDHPDEFKKMLKPYVKPPEEWITNLWENSRLKSDRLKAEKKIPADDKSFEETIFTPSIQNERHKKLMQKK